MKYERITITRFSISGGFIAVIVMIIALAAAHKQVGPAVHTGLEVIKWTLVGIGSAMGLGILTGITYLALRARRVIIAARKRRNGPQTITFYPSYVLNSEPVAEIAPPSIWHDGEEYVKVIQRDKIRHSSRYGKGALQSSNG